MNQRRALLAAIAGALAGGSFARPLGASAAKTRSGAEQIVALEKQNGGRLGVAVLDTASGESISHRADERFPLCGTFKLLAAAAVLKRVDAGLERLERVIAYGPPELTEYAPVAKAHVGEGGMRLGDLCAAAVDWSDNTAGNLMLQVVGGPAGLTQYARSLGDAVTRLDRTEPSLNTAFPGDDRDTTSPRAMMRDIKALLLGDALSEPSRRQLESWLIADKVGDQRIRAGLPRSWIVGDKTGTGDNGATNTIAILWPPQSAPILACVYYTGSAASLEARNKVHAEIGRIIAGGV